MQENILADVGPATIDGPPVERKQERKVRGIGEGAAKQREETMEDGSLHSLSFAIMLCTRTMRTARNNRSAACVSQAGKEGSWDWRGLKAFHVMFLLVTVLDTTWEHVHAIL